MTCEIRSRAAGCEIYRGMSGVVAAAGVVMMGVCTQRLLSSPESNVRQFSPPIRQERTIEAAIQMANVPISFWGKVTDQDGNPLSDVEIAFNYSVERGNGLGIAWSDTKIVKGKTRSDGSGLFSITGIQGSALGIESFEKAGFRYNSRGAIVFNYFGHTASGKFTPDRDHPISFVMVSEAARESLVSLGGNFGKTMRLPGDGTPARWSVWKGVTDPDGELQITFRRDPVVVARVGDHVSWSAKLAIVNGGIVEASSDEAFYRAPDNGYLPEIAFSALEQKKGTSARNFYIKTGDGKYGRIQVDLYPDDEGPTARCLIKTVMNPAESRVLESAP